MREPYWRSDAATLHVGDARQVMAEMPDGCVDTIVTSPPFWGQRDYGVPGQYGLEPSPQGYVAHLRIAFTEAQRVLAADGTLWLNLGDGYAGSWGNYVASGSVRSRQADDPHRVARYGTFRPPQSRLRPKNLIGLPWRVAFALQQDGWLLRSAVVWHKPNAMPSSVRDRLSTQYELIFLLTKQLDHWFDLDALRAVSTDDRSSTRHVLRDGNRTCRTGGTPFGNGTSADRGRHRRRHAGDVWSISTRPFRQAHFAVFPVELPLRCIATGCRPGGTVLDPFAGAATTGVAARRLARQFIGIDLNSACADLAAARLTHDRAHE